jgi:exonuclease III
MGPKLITLLLIILLTMNTQKFKSGTLNVNGLRSVESDKRSATFQWIKENKFDIMFLQETHAESDYDNQVWGKEWGGESFWSNGTTHARGAAILVSNKIKVIRDSFKKDIEGRIVRIRFEWEGKTYTALNIYAPNKNRKTFFEKLKNDWITADNNIIFGGDFNCVEDVIKDKNGAQTFGTEGVPTLNEINNMYHTVDHWRLWNPDKRQGTWTDNNGKWSRIDKFYCNIMTHNICETNIIPFMHSDHDCVSLTCENSNIFKGPGLWKLNTSLLLRDEYNIMVKDLITEILESNVHRFENFLERWDYFKIRIKEESKSLSKKLNRKKQKHTRKLLKDYEKATEAKNEGRVQYLREQLKNIELQEAKGLKIRSKAKWHEEGETSSRYFCKLEKRNGEDRLFRSVRKEDGSVVNTTQEIMKEQIKFYSNLYSKQNINDDVMEDFLNAVDAKLKEEEANDIEHGFSSAEILTAIKSFDNHKSPGIDGLGAEFYKHFWGDLEAHLIKMVSTVFETGTLSSSQRQGIITLLYKKGPREELKNWRPITLLNVDYKIITKVLAKRLGQVLPLIIDEDQTCAIKNRHIETNIHLIRDILEYCNSENKPLALIALDQEKAFDRVEWKFLNKVLSKFNFGNNFRKWIQILYNTISSNIMCNGYISDQISPTRGLRQGCPLSALLYILTAETLACNIRKADIDGFTFPDSDKELRIKQYADDNILAITTNRSINNAFEVIRKYEEASGAKLNAQKTEGLWAGAWKDRQEQPLGIKWVSDTLKLTGIQLGNIPVDELNFRSKLEKLRSVLAVWKQRNLSLKGKSVVIESIASSGLWYYTNVLTKPKWLNQDFKSIIFDFLWSGKGRPMKDKTTQLPFAKGGLNIVDLEFKVETQRIMLIKKLIQSEEKWTILPKYWFNKLLLQGTEISLGFDVFHTNLVPTNLKALPKFYYDILQAWKKAGGCRKLNNPLQIRNEYTIGNKDMLRPNGNPFRHNQFIIENNYTKIGNVLDNFPIRRRGHLVKYFELRNTVLRTFPNVNDLNRDGDIANDKPVLGISSEENPNFFHVTTLTGKIFKSINYTKFNNNTPRAHEAWQTKLGEILSEDFFKEVYSNLRHKDHNRQISDVSYKIIHEILPTGKRLQKIGITNNPLCSICQNKRESVCHLFTRCQDIISFWMYVFKFLQIICPQIPFMRKTIIFGIYDQRYNENNKRLANYLIIVAKYSIWQYRNSIRFQDKRIDIKAKFVSIVKANMAHQLHLHNFDRDFWCINNSISAVENNKIKFTIK